MFNTQGTITGRFKANKLNKSNKPKEKTYIKKPCKHCPYRNDVTPFLINSRAEELAYLAKVKFASFPCHKTTEHEDLDNGYGDMVITSKTKECAGYLTLRAQVGNFIPEDFKPSLDIVYTSPEEMVEAYFKENNK